MDLEYPSGTQDILSKDYNNHLSFLLSVEYMINQVET
jgi:hypothetical protein